MKFRALGLLALGWALPCAAFAANNWVNMLVQDPAGGLTTGRVCYSTNGHDISCDAGAPLITTSGSLYVPGTLTAGSFVGNGSGLTGVVASTADRIVSGTTSMIAVSTSGYISITQAATDTGWFDPTRGLVTIGVSSTGPVSATNGYFSGNVGIGTTQPTNSGAGFTTLGLNGSTAGVLEFRAGDVRQAQLYSTTSNFFAGSVAAIPFGFTTSNTERMRIDASGNVGIGTSAPSTTLDVRGNIRLLTGGNSQGLLGQDGSNNYLFSLTRQSNDLSIQSYGAMGFAANQIGGPGTTYSMIISNGLVGIGTSSPGTIFQVHAATNLNFNIDSNSSGVRLSSLNDALSANSPLRLQASEYHFVGQAGSSEPMTISASGNVGIGTTSPGGSLDVSGGTITRAITIKTNGAGDNIIFANSAASAKWFQYLVGNDLRFSDGADRFVLQSGGNVGISTASPGAPLEVGATATSGGLEGGGMTAIFNLPADSLYGVGVQRGGVVNPQVLLFGVNQASSYSEIQAAHNNVAVNNLVLNRQGGNVGIGTVSPVVTLDVGGGNAARTASLSNPMFYSGIPGNNGWGGIVLGSGANGNAPFIAASKDGTGAALSLSLITSATIRTFIDANGNVGISTTSPNAKLDVYGTVSATNFVGNGSGLVGVVASASPGGPSGSIQFNLNGSSTSGSTAFVIQNNNVGIGTATPSTTVDVIGRFRIASNGGLPPAPTGGRGLALLYNGGSNTGNVSSFDNDNSVYRNLQLEGAATYLNSASGGNVGIGSGMSGISLTATLQVSGTFTVSNSAQTTNPSIYVSATNGFVGIGTSNPVVTLNASGPGNTDLIRMDGNTGSYVGLSFAPSGTQISSGHAGKIRGYANGTDTDLAFVTNAIERMRILATGNIGIGTATPTTALEVSGTISATNFVGNGSGLAGVTAAAAGPSGSIQFNLGGSSTSGTAAFTFLNNNIGIGTVSPLSATLEVSGSGKFTRGLTVAPAGSGDSIVFRDTTTTKWTQYLSGNDFNFYDVPSATTRLTLQGGTGNVGIGTSAPGIVTGAGRTYLTLKGSSDAGVLEMATAAADTAGNEMGMLQFTDVNSSARGALISAKLAGTTAGNRGGSLNFYTKADGASSLVQRMIMDQSGNVGISTTSPQSKLSVGIPSTALGTAVGAGAGITVGVANAIGFSGENTSAQTVGQGAFLTLYQNDGTAMLSGNRLGGVIFGGASSASALRNSASLQAYADDNWVDGSDYGSYLSLFTTTDGAASRTEKMRITSSGNVGISTTSPNAKLDVYGTISATNFVGNGSGLSGVTASPGGPSGSIQFNLGGSSTSGTAAFVFSNNVIGLGTATPVSTQGIVYHAYNNANTGTSASNASFIADSVYRNATFQGRISSSGSTSFQSVAPDYSASYGQMSIFANSGSPYMALYVSGTEKVRVDQSGNVGIGTTAPSTTLYVQKGSAGGAPAWSTSDVAVFENTAGTAAYIQALSSAASGLVMSTPATRAKYYVLSSEANQAMMFGVSGTEVMRIVSSGNVGIGTASPGTKLDVNGQMQSEGNYTVNYAVTNDGLIVGTGRGSDAVIVANLASGSADLLSLDNAGINKFKVTSAGTVSAVNFVGNGSGLTNIPAGGAAGTTTQLQYNNGGVIAGGSVYYVSSSGNVGIGLTPSAGISLDIVTNQNTQSYVRNINLSSAGNAQVLYQLATGATNAYVNSYLFNANGTPGYELVSGPGVTSGMSLITLGSGVPIVFQPSNTEAMRITGAGNVGINKTDPGNLLTLKSTAASSFPFVIYDHTNATTGLFVGEGSGGDFGLTINNASNVNKVNLTSNGSSYFTGGNVGIGTSGPAAKLQIEPDSGIHDGTNYGQALQIVRAATAGQQVSFIRSGNRVISVGYLPNSNVFGFGAGTATDSSFTPGLLAMDGSGNVGIGTTGSLGRLGVASGLNAVGTTDASTTIPGILITTLDNGGVLAGNDINHSIFFRHGQDGSTDVTDFHEYGKLRFYTGGTVQSQPLRMVIDNTGNVGIGTTGPAGKLEVDGATLSGGDATYRGDLILVGNSGGIQSLAQNGGLEFKAALSGSGYGWRIVTPDLGGGSTPMVFQSRASSASWSESMRITNAGYVGIGTTSPAAQLEISSTSINTISTTAWGVASNLTANKNNTSGGFAVFSYNNASVGSITTNGTTTSYNTTSDRRLKENIADTTMGLGKLSQIHVEDFNFIADPSKSRVQGFIAQDLYKTYPEAVTVGGADAKKHPWAVDYGRLTPLIVRAVQELKGLFDTDHTAIEALKNADGKLKADNDNLRSDMAKLKAEETALKAANDNLQNELHAIECRLKQLH